MKEEIIRNILNGMHLYLSSEQLRQLENVILTVLINYDFVEKKQEIIEKNTGWQFDLRDFLVQKKIEGKSEKTLKQYKYQLFKLLSSINNNLFNLNYETSEVKTGEVWIDGKPIYRKVFQVSAIQSKAVTINHNISNANIVWVDTSHSFLLVGNNTYSLPRIGNSINQCVGVQATRSTFTISAGSDASFSGGAIVTLLYTKTT